jgi:hypothetical protein
LYYAAKSLMKFQQMFGHIPNIKGRGKHAQTVADMLLRFTQEVHLSSLAFWSGTACERCQHRRSPLRRVCNRVSLCDANRKPCRESEES